ncbi:MAG: histidine--tRNA ligase, partial [Candidatus Bilamarchaeaceae archaeon]
KGRFREFYQADADIVGCKGMRAEAELLMMAKGLLAEFGFGKPRILLNNRKVLEGIVSKLGISEKKNAVFRALDKLDKISGREVEDMLEAEVGREKMEALLEVFSAEGNRERLKAAKKYSEEGAKELEEILRLCGGGGKGDAGSGIEIELAMVRGLGYYTGPIFEIKLSENMGTVVAGGRYDGLLGLYGQEDSAVGISVGIERLIALLKEKKEAGGADCRGVFVVNVKPETYGYALRVAEGLRAGGVPAETDLNERNMRKQMDYANARGHRLMAIVGEKEASEKKVTLKDMRSGAQETVALGEAAEKARAFLAI